MEQIVSYLEAVKFARKQVCGNLTVFPLLAPGGTDPDYLTLEQALGLDIIRITEVDSNGRVPDLRLVNLGGEKVLIVEGEELVGAKQNRIVNATFLISGNSEVLIPVSCVEQGRWRYKSDVFRSGNKMMPASLRRTHQHDVRSSLERGQGHRSNQGRIWDGIAEKSARMRVAAPTGAMADVFESYESKLSGILSGFKPVEWQIGAVFAVNGRVLGLEGFGSPDTFARFYEKLIKSYALDALDCLDAKSDTSVPPLKARRLVKSIIKAESKSNPSVGIGENITFASRRISGAALVEGSRVVHISAFKKDKEDHRVGLQSVGFRRYSQRRNRRI